MEEQNNQAHKQDISVSPLGGPLIVVSENDGVGKVIKPSQQNYDNEDQDNELQDKDDIQLEFQKLLEAYFALKTRNEELESQLSQMEERPWEKLKLIDLTLDDSPFTRILELQYELKAVKKELAFARTREGWFKKYIWREKYDTNCSGPDTRNNQELCPVETKQELWHVDKTNQGVCLDEKPKPNHTLRLSKSTLGFEHINSNTYPASRRNSDFQPNQPCNTGRVFAGLGNAITRNRNFASSVLLSQAPRAVSNLESVSSLNADWGNNSNGYSMNSRHSALQSNGHRGTNEVLSNLAGSLRKIASLNKVSRAPGARSNVENTSTSNADWGDHSIEHSVSSGHSALQSNGQRGKNEILTNLGNSLGKITSSNKFSRASSARSPVENTPSSNADWGNNSNEHSANSGHSALQSNGHGGKNEIFANLGNTLRKIASSNTLSLAPQTRCDEKEGPPASATWGNQL